MYIYYNMLYFIYPVSELPNSVQVALGGLQQQLEESVQRWSAEIEDKIRAFTAKQYQLLEQFRERAHNEHRLLTRSGMQISNAIARRVDLEFIFLNLYLLRVLQDNMQRRRSS